MSIIISKDFTFEASHVLPKHPGQCSRLHGHSWGLKVSIIGPVDRETGFVADYGRLKELVKTNVIDLVDHQHLGYGVMIGSDGSDARTYPDPPFGKLFYPSSENMVMAITRILSPLIQELGLNVRLFEVEIKETCTSAARYTYPESR